MQIHFITVHPNFIEAYKLFGVFKAAQEKNKATLHAIALRDFAVDKHGSIDSRPYGGGDSMILRPEPLAHAVQSIGSPKPYVILTSPRGKTWHHSDATRLQKIDRPLAIVCGRFGGVDERFISQYVDEEISLGDFILSGGEIPALAIADAILRLIPGVLGNEESAQIDSFSDQLAGTLEYPLYSKPPTFEGISVPDILLSGDHKAIQRWREQEALKLTQKHRPDLLENSHRHPDC